MRMTKVLALVAVAALALEAPAAFAGDGTPVEADSTQVYMGKARTSQAPAVVDADSVFKSITEYQRILEEKLTEKDVRYSFLMMRANKKFRKAVDAGAREEGKDLVGNIGTVKWGENQVPDITATVVSHVKLAESVAAMRPAGGAAGEVGTITLTPEGQPETADFSSSKLSDAGLSSMKNIEALKAIDLTATPVGDDGILHIEGSSTLEVLNLAGTNVTDKGLAKLDGLTALRTLDLSGTRITDEALAGVAKVPALKKLKLGYTVVTDAGIAALTGAKTLETLDLSFTKVTDGVFATFKKIVNLKKVDLSGVKVSEEAVKAFRDACTTVEVVHEPAK